MKITNEQAEYLLQLPKKVVNKEELLDKLSIDQKFPFNARYELISESDIEFTFLWEIKQSSKNKIKISLHHQENDSKTGIFRIDYNGSHTNPMTANEFVPEKYHSFVGKYFNNEHHVHYYVEGYKPLAWAIPLSADEFEIKDLGNKSDFNITFAKVIVEFAKAINLKTIITVNPLLI